MTIRQQIHNFIYGENSRQENRRWHYAFMTNDEWLAIVSRGIVALTSPDPARVWGIDISGRWDGVVDLSVTRERGGRFVFIKGLDGTVRTRLYAENRSNAIIAGMLHGPYCWLYRDRNVPCRNQAQEADRLLKEYPADLPAMLDFEWTKYAGEYSNPDYTDLDKWVTEFLRLGNRKPLLYTAAGYMNTYGKIPDALKAKFCGIVIANYGVINPTMPYGWVGGWDFWQFSASGDATIYAPNNTGKLEVDLDYWRSDLTSLYAFAGANIPPGNGEPMTTRYEATSDYNMSLRSHPNVDNVPLGSVPPGSRMHGDDLFEVVGEQWLNVTDINGQPPKDRNGNVITVPVWVAIVHEGRLYCHLVDNGAPSPQPEPETHLIQVIVDGVEKYRLELP